MKRKTKLLKALLTIAIIGGLFFLIKTSFGLDWSSIFGKKSEKEVKTRESAQKMMQVAFSPDSPDRAKFEKHIKTGPYAEQKAAEKDAKIKFERLKKLNDSRRNKEEFKKIAMEEYGEGVRIIDLDRDKGKAETIDNTTIFVSDTPMNLHIEEDGGRLRVTDDSRDFAVRVNPSKPMVFLGSPGSDRISYVSRSIDKHVEIFDVKFELLKERVNKHRETRDKVRA